MTRVLCNLGVECINLVLGALEQLVEQVTKSDEHSGDIALWIVALRDPDDLIDFRGANGGRHSADVPDSLHGVTSLWLCWSKVPRCPRFSGLERQECVLQDAVLVGLGRIKPLSNQLYGSWVADDGEAVTVFDDLATGRNE